MREPFRSSSERLAQIRPGLYSYSATEIPPPDGPRSIQAFKAFRKPGERRWEAYARFRRREDDKACRLARGELAHQRVVDDDFGKAAEFPAFQKFYIADIGTVDPQAQAGGQYNAQWRHDAQDLLIAVEGAHQQHREEHIGPVFKLQILNERAFVLLCACYLGAFQLPCPINGLDLPGADLGLGVNLKAARSQGEKDTEG